LAILITGGAGFIGTFTKELLKKEGYQVIVFDNLITGREENIDEDDIFIKGDICNPSIFHLLKKYKIETIIHLAAQTSVPKSVDNPLYDVRQNIDGTIHLLQLANELGVERFIFASSAAVYGDHDCLPISEEVNLSPTSPYGITKMAGEKYVEIYCKLYNISYIIFRYANVFGPKQTSDGEGGVIKIFFDKMLNGESPIIYGDGNQTRDFIYVEDIARAHLMALDAPSGIYNVSTNTETSINQLYKWISDMTKQTMDPIYSLPRKGDIYRSRLNNEKITLNLGWSPIFSVEKGLKRTMEILTER
jgi:UDP-glucose 4-epimerase